MCLLHFSLKNLIRLRKKARKQIIFTVWFHSTIEIRSSEQGCWMGQCVNYKHWRIKSLLNRSGWRSLISQSCTCISLQQPHLLEEREKQGVVNLPVHFSSEAFILKPLMVTSPFPHTTGFSPHCTLHCTFPYLTPCSLWPPLQFTNSDSHAPFSSHREETASIWTSNLLGKGPSIHKLQDIIVQIKMFTCYQPCSYSNIYFGKYYIWKMGTIPEYSLTLK